MSERTMNADETVARGGDYYNQHLRSLVEPEHHGKFLVLDVDTGDYEIDSDEIAALKRAMAKGPDAHRFLFRVGYRAAHTIGGAQATHASV